MGHDDYKFYFHEGTLKDGYNYFGCHYDQKTGRSVFRVFAPHAKSVAVIGDFNGWNRTANYMWKVSDGGIYEGIIDGTSEYQLYKYLIETYDGRTIEKCDPCGFFHETRGSSASKITNIDNFYWNDGEWMADRAARAPYDRPVSIYECNISSWRKYPDGNDYDYRKFADEIIYYVKYMNFTHIELMGISEYPFDGSWGYQVTGYYAPTSRYGRPEDFAYLVNKCHEAGIGVILDWVPGHFPKDEFGLYNFDGEPCYEPSHPLRSEHLEWGTMCFDYGKPEVKSFLISNALMWFDKYHVDGLRVDAVASMLYHDYSRTEWLPNIHGGNENLEAIDFLRQMNTAIFGAHSGVMMIAEDSTAFPGVTKPVAWGGLGFNYKWNMGWMNDTLAYVKDDPYYRKYKHGQLTFSMAYAFSENYVLPISHDEVVHGKGSLINKMPGDYELKFAGIRNYLAYMFSHPGKKLLFMGTEFGQWAEWNYEAPIDWLLIEFPQHKSLQSFVRELNNVYKSYPALHQIDNSWDGFEWLVADDAFANVIAFERSDSNGNKALVVINFAPCEWKGYRMPSSAGKYTRILRTSFSGWDKEPVTVESENIPNRHKPDSIILDIEMMSAYIFYYEAKPIKPEKPKMKSPSEKPKMKSPSEKSKTKKETKAKKV